MCSSDLTRKIQLARLVRVGVLDENERPAPSGDRLTWLTWYLPGVFDGGDFGRDREGRAMLGEEIEGNRLQIGVGPRNLLGKKTNNQKRRYAFEGQTPGRGQTLGQGLSPAFRITI